MPVWAPVTPIGRVIAGEMPEVTVARTHHRGGYDGLPVAWAYFEAWLRASGYRPREDLWEVYVWGSLNSAKPAEWVTQLNRPLA